MSIASLRADVARAEAEAGEASGALAVRRAALAERARLHWYPRALVGVGAMVGYWFEGHLNGGFSQTDSAEPRRKDPNIDPQQENASDRSSADGIAGWLGLAVSAFRLADFLKPLLDKQSADDACNASQQDAAAAAAAEEVTAQTDLFTVADPLAHAERHS